MIKVAGLGGGWDALPPSAQVVDLLRQRLQADDPRRNMLGTIEQLGIVDIVDVGATAERDSLWQAQVYPEGSQK